MAIRTSRNVLNDYQFKFKLGEHFYIKYKRLFPIKTVQNWRCKVAAAQRVTVNTTVVVSIPTQKKELFSFPRSGTFLSFLGGSRLSKN